MNYNNEPDLIDSLFENDQPSVKEEPKQKSSIYKKEFYKEPDLIDSLFEEPEQQMDSEEEPFWKSLLKQQASLPIDALKGLIEASESVGRMMGPLQGPQPSREKLSKGLDELIPTPRESFIGSAARRGIRAGAPALAFPGGATNLTSLGLRSGAAGLLGETVKAMGGGETAQDLSELAAFISPDVYKTLLAKGNKKEIIDFLRSKGLTDEQITPLLQGGKRKIFGYEIPSKEQLLSGLAKKGSRSESALEETYSGLGKVYDKLRKLPAAQIVLNPEDQNIFKSEIEKLLLEIPSTDRELILKDIGDLYNGEMNGDNLINLWQDISRNYRKAPKLESLKEPIRNAIAKLDPQLYKDFKLTNELYKKYISIAEKLTPKQNFDLFTTIKASKYGSLAWGIFTGDFLGIAGYLGYTSAEHLARELLINPRLQNISGRIIDAMKVGKYAIANNLKRQLTAELEDNFPEVASMLDETDLNDLKNKDAKQKK